MRWILLPFAFSCLFEILSRKGAESFCTSSFGRRRFLSHRWEHFQRRQNGYQHQHTRIRQKHHVTSRQENSVLLFSPSSFSSMTHNTPASFTPSLLQMVKQQSDKQTNTSKKAKKQSKSTVVGEDISSTAPLEPVGTKFFGGAAQKEELLDLEMEEKAGEDMRQQRQKDEEEALRYNKFEDRTAFEDDFVAGVAESIQKVINSVMYEDEEDGIADTSSLAEMYGANFDWTSPLSSKNNSKEQTKKPTPLDRITKALEYYTRLDIAITSGKSLADASTNNSNNKKVELRWVIALIWPNAWESRVTFSGTSTLTLESSTDKRIRILQQIDRLDNGGKDGLDIVSAMSHQLTPRFWDVYHTGMTPSAETVQRLPLSNSKSGGKGLFSNYNIFELAPRWVYRASMVDQGGREERQAQYLPNHAFTCMIKTVGPSRQRYVPTNPLEISISAAAASTSSKRGNVVTWTVPIPVELASNKYLPLPIPEKDTDDANDDDALFRPLPSEYQHQPRRRVATLSYGGDPQDIQVTDLRKKLYEAVIKDGFQPKMSESGKPMFFFLQNEAKLCFTEEGLGMVVYDSRPDFVQGNEVGLELECD